MKKLKVSLIVWTLLASSKGITSDGTLDLKTNKPDKYLVKGEKTPFEGVLVDLPNYRAFTLAAELQPVCEESMKDCAEIKNSFWNDYGKPIVFMSLGLTVGCSIARSKPCFLVW